MNKNNHTESLDNFFSFISKAVIIIPIFVLIISLFFKFNSPKNSTVNNLLVPTVIPTIKTEFKFDLKGPIVCDSIFVKDKKVLLKNKSINYLLNGDCLYTWEAGKSSGQKKCGLSNYVSMAENYLGLVNINDLLNNNLIKDKIKIKDINLEKVIKSCRRGEIENKEVFEIPKQILFN